jgi:predicted N-acetyltransferase YhbS
MIAIREYCPSDTEQVDRLMETATRELRAVYTPKSSDKIEQREQSISSLKIVAEDNDGSIVGVAEFFVRSADIYAQGIAVAASHRRSGVATALLAHITALANDLGVLQVQIKTIKETGNVEIFKHLGFEVILENISARFVGLNEKPVTEITMQRYLKNKALE